MNDAIDLYRPKLPTTFGSAAWATMRDLRMQNMLEVVKGKNMGPLIGCLTPAEIGGRDLQHLYASGDGHLLSVAPSGAGKTRGQVASNLLWYPGSALVVDIKGENWERTAGCAREQRLTSFPRHRTRRLDWDGILFSPVPVLGYDGTLPLNLI